MKRITILIWLLLLAPMLAQAQGISPWGSAGGGGGSGDFLADGTVPMTGAPVPNAVNTIALGSNAAEWADLFLGDGAVIYGQNDSSATLTSSAGVWTASRIDGPHNGTVGATTPAAGTFTSVISKKVVTHTTTGSVALTCAANSSGVFTNSGADADVTYTLEECVVGVEGCHFTFIITDFAVAGDEFWVDAHANDQFYGMYSTNANGDKLEGDNVLGSILNVLCLKNTAGTYEWFTTGHGAWTDAD